MNANASSESQATMRKNHPRSRLLDASCVVPSSSRKRRSEDWGTNKQNKEDGEKMPKVNNDVAPKVRKRRARKRRQRSNTESTDVEEVESRHGVQKRRVGRQNKISNGTRENDSNTPKASFSALIKNNDVLFGRGKAYFEHPGNLEFRRICAENLNHYRIASCRSRKVSIIQEIQDEIRLSGGKFLKRDQDGHWQETSTNTAKEKVGHTLRDALVNSRNNGVMKMQEEDRRKGANKRSTSSPSPTSNHHSPTSSQDNSGIHRLLGARKGITENSKRLVEGKRENSKNKKNVLAPSQPPLSPFTNQLLQMQSPGAPVQSHQWIDHYWENPVDSDELQDDLISLEGEFDHDN
mmetsp:Transcript_4293/g.7164  ORF Transcript_4293/g.7164 Transcript_4293/m.7164 type:complete len:350 (+) Transcript_4293:157-1206(+)|eukprot:CAMPEP_0119016602 /NCGR_PEP_ID=MMETSP1176-20130426/13780_1 /TAXON_ID=265551 /ORGANISM="Synedropsis recta cf, Strain CCMP1620" /LENGTH=349 /DNA_ID=CAMNT_0006970083 /DNA_START=97 /DNA_END=1146 /DNA_ORIENTATION=-